MWTNVNVKLPRFWRPVLVTMQWHDGSRRVTVAHRTDDGTSIINWREGTDMQTGAFLYYVLAWAPLPRAWRGGK